MSRVARATALLTVCVGAPAMCQSVLPELDPAEKPGTRPYEMVRAGRREPAPPTLRFDDLHGWTMSVAGGAEAALQASRAQDLWGRPVARLRYRGAGRESPGASVVLRPPAPVALPEGADCVDMWVYGNRWDWVNPPGTPPVRVVLNLRDGSGLHPLQVDSVRWEEWWLMHRRLPAGMRPPATLDSVEIAGGWQPEWRDIYLDSARFYREDRKPLRIAPRPRRNLSLAAGQSPGANTGPGRLAFPTRETTILPVQLGGKFRNRVTAQGDGWVFTYDGADTSVVYRFHPERGLGGIEATCAGKPAGRPLDSAAVQGGEAGAPRRLEASADRGVVTCLYADGTKLRLQIRQKSLIVDVANPGGAATGLRLGSWSGVREPRAVYVPPITFGSTNPTVLLARSGTGWFCGSVWVDWYRSNGSELYGAEQASGTSARINGGVRYNLRTDGRRNPLFERLFVTVSPVFEEVLPTVPNPVGRHARQAAARLWQESWGPDNFEKQAKRSETLRAYGIRMLTQCNHEISWRDGGESFTLRVHAAPGKGGDEAQRRYVAHQRGLGWFSGLYTNYTDFAPVNEHWDPDAVQREPSGEWRSAWPRCWALKPLRAVELEARLAPEVARRYGGNSSYTDVHTAVAPWAYTDYDARLPGAGTFAQTFYAYGELLRNDSHVYGGPIFSEGTYQWLYAGLADGNYGHTYNGRGLATEPLLPAFDLHQIHTKECDIGVSWTAFFCDAIPNWRAPANIDRAIDRFLLTTLAYGHIGWLVEEEHGIARTCRSYYMLQQVQARYGLKAPLRIAYWDGRAFRTTSGALPLDLPRARRQLLVEYPGGLLLWLNDSATEAWRVRVGARTIVLPPAGWAAWQPASKGPGADPGFLTWSALVDGRKADYLRSAAYIYLDGRGAWLSTPEAAFSGSLAIEPAGPGRVRVTRISGEGPFVVRRPYGARGTVVRCEVRNVEGKRLADAALRESGAETWVEPVAGGLTYLLVFTGKPSWRVAPAFGEAAPGALVPLRVTGGPVSWPSGEAVLRVPASARPGEVVTARATRGGAAREARVRVVAPVTLNWTAAAAPESTRLRLGAAWRLAGLAPTALAIELRAPTGWEVRPKRFAVDPRRPPTEFEATITTDAPVGAVAGLQVRVTGLPSPARVEISLSRALQHPVVVDVARLGRSWGITRRGGADTTAVAGTGAACDFLDPMPVGGVSRPGIFMHPPYTGGVGRTWTETTAVRLPAEPCEFHCWVGIKDGGDASDGVWYSVQAAADGGAWRTVGEAVGAQHAWRELRADLSGFAGRRVRLRLVVDVGPANNSTADWACWGEPAIRRTRPLPLTQVAGP
ncbi:MAG: hypothetical protein IT208_13140 [Chthonomonadales bacterium]|nr:hypothetical protein [Chthonomonadales bacterium]